MLKFAFDPNCSKCRGSGIEKYYAVVGFVFDDNGDVVPFERECSCKHEVADDSDYDFTATQYRDPNDPAPWPQSLKDSKFDDDQFFNTTVGPIEKD